MVVYVDFMCNWTLNSRSIAPQNDRDFNQRLSHLWSKFGDTSLNGRWVITRTSSWLPHRQTQTTTIPRGQTWPRMNTILVKAIWHRSIMSKQFVEWSSRNSLPNKLYHITFIFARCRRSSAAVTPGKYGCNSKDLTNAMTSNGSWCIGIKGEMSGTVCVTFTWDIHIYMSCL